MSTEPWVGDKGCPQSLLSQGPHLRPHVLQSLCPLQAAGYQQRQTFAAPEWGVGVAEIKVG